MVVMTIYKTVARWGAMKLSEEMEIRSDLDPHNEAEYVKNFLLQKWIRVFGPAFIEAADEVLVQNIELGIGNPGVDASGLELENKAGHL